MLKAIEGRKKLKIIGEIQLFQSGPIVPNQAKSGNF
jgi:hypothetical protein